MAVKRHHIGCLGGQTVENHHFTTSGLVKHSHFHSISETAHPVRKDDVDVFDEGVMADSIVGDVVLYMFDAAIVADCHVMECGIGDSGMFPHSSRQFEFLAERTQTYVSREAGVHDMFRGEIF